MDDKSPTWTYTTWQYSSPMNPSSVIQTLVHDIHQNAIDKGFWDKSQNVGEKLMLINTEMSEFFERYRCGDMSPDQHCPEFNNQTVELADTLIRLLDLAGWLQMHDLGEAVLAKMAYNKSRPYLHGKKF